MHCHKGVLERFLEASQHTDNVFDCWQYQRSAILRDLENEPMSITVDVAKAIEQITELRQLLDSLCK